VGVQPEGAAVCGDDRGRAGPDHRHDRTDLCAHYKNHAFGVYPTAYMPPVLSYANFSIRP